MERLRLIWMVIPKLAPFRRIALACTGNKNPAIAACDASAPTSKYSSRTGAVADGGVVPEDTARQVDAPRAHRGVDRPSEGEPGQRAVTSAETKA
jgi:hypothetical protein